MLAEATSGFVVRTTNVRGSGEVNVMTVGATSGLDPDYAAARRRLFSLTRPTLDCRHYAWLWLSKWRRLMKDRHHVALPAPHIFSNEHAVVEFEWEIGPRFLQLRLIPNDLFEFVKVDEASDVEEGGQVGINGVCRLLEWVLGRTNAGPRR